MIDKELILKRILPNDVENKNILLERMDPGVKTASRMQKPDDGK
jgi:hypothetical protein